MDILNMGFCISLSADKINHAPIANWNKKLMAILIEISAEFCLN